MTRRHAVLGFLALVAPAALWLFKEWSATIRPQDGSTVSGTATAAPMAGDSLLLNIRISGAKAGETHPWHLHAGGCDSSGAVLGATAAYQAVRIGADQNGQSTAKVKVSLAVGVPYSVNVHRSPTEMAVIACGNLRPVAGH